MSRKQQLALFPDDIGRATISDGKVWLRKNWTKGAQCPCCTRVVKLYARIITSAMALALLLIDREFRANPPEEGWLHVPSFLAGQHQLGPETLAAIRGDWAKLRYWGLLEPRPGRREDGSKRNGYYRTTPLTRQFIDGGAHVPKRIFVFKETAWGHPSPSDEMTTLREALGRKFDYSKLMEPGGALPQEGPM